MNIASNYLVELLLMSISPHAPNAVCMFSSNDARVIVCESAGAALLIFMNSSHRDQINSMMRGQNIYIYSLEYLLVCSLTEGFCTTQVHLPCAKLQLHSPWVIGVQNLHKPVRTHR
jgi:hypothetical protein